MSPTVDSKEPFLQGNSSAKTVLGNSSAETGASQSLTLCGFTSSQQNQTVSSHLVPEGMHLSSSSNICGKDKNISARRGDVILLTDDKFEESKALHLNEVKEESNVKKSETLARLNSNDNVTTCNAQEDIVLVRPEINASVISGSDKISQHVMEKSDNISTVASLEIKDQGEEGPSTPSSQLLVSVVKKPSHCENSIGALIAKERSKFLANKEESTTGITNFGGHLQQPELVVSAKINDDGKVEPYSAPNQAHGELVTVGPSCLPSSIDRQNRMQKGPRVAKVARKVNWTVETLEYGVILSGKLWSCSQAIFPKGYKSRVRYFSILDPSQMCYYICEVLAAGGLLGPLFMVTVEQCPSEVFIQVSATKCWDMVRDRVNNEIRRHQNLGRSNLPLLQPPRSLDGLEMFGLTSPTIMQAIEAMDRYHDCTEYWSSRPQTPAEIRPTTAVGDDQLDRAVVALRGLIKKGAQVELQELHRVLSSDQPNARRQLLGLLNEEFERCPR